MTTYAQLRTRIVERLGEYHAGAAEGTTTSSFSVQTIYDRITQVYRDMLGEIAERDPEKVVTTTAMTYTAAAESVALPAAVARQRIFEVAQLVGSTYEPIRRSTIAEEQAERRAEVGPSDYRYRIERTSMWIWPIPQTALTLRIRHVAAIVALIAATDDANSPDLIPEEFHALLAMRTAASFRLETGGLTFGEELTNANERFLRWVASGDNDGPRTVRMVTDF